MLSQELTQILEGPFIIHHWDLRLQALLLRQQALDLEEALATKLQARPIAQRPFHYVPGYRDLVPAQHLRPASINTTADAMVVFGD